MECTSYTESSDNEDIIKSPVSYWSSVQKFHKDIGKAYVCLYKKKVYEI